MPLHSRSEAADAARHWAFAHVRRPNAPIPIPVEPLEAGDEGRGVLHVDQLGARLAKTGAAKTNEQVTVRGYGPILRSEVYSGEVVCCCQ